ncbi:MAG: hypothetical protein NTW67_05170 [Candidatus Woesearchaeota archaeon]|nr:hypothetical protein [Candidatus Woesearchaeota archaeon]
MTEPNEENCGQFSIKDLKPVQPENTYKCKDCPFTKNPQACFQMMMHSDTYCQKYLKD